MPLHLLQRADTKCLRLGPKQSVWFVFLLGAAFITIVPERPCAQAPPARPGVPLDPIPAIMEAFRSHQLVAIGDAHGNTQGAAFQLDLIRDPRFTGVVNDILV
jgi:hypothetical protein